MKGNGHNVIAKGRDVAVKGLPQLVFAVIGPLPKRPRNQHDSDKANENERGSIHKSLCRVRLLSAGWVTIAAEVLVVNVESVPVFTLMFAIDGAARMAVAFDARNVHACGVRAVSSLMAIGASDAFVGTALQRKFCFRVRRCFAGWMASQAKFPLQRGAHKGVACTN
ncbi:MAG TPA: hypothetical protein PLF40_07585, partial [Kofleriaceae bacterium]|nr:hypothetical protein [Kofleriaceae bacterium]